MYGQSLSGALLHYHCFWYKNVCFCFFSANDHEIIPLTACTKLYLVTMPLYKIIKKDNDVLQNSSNCTIYIFLVSKTFPAIA